MPYRYSDSERGNVASMASRDGTVKIEGDAKAPILSVPGLAGKVSSIAAADTSIVVGGTTTAVTLRATNNVSAANPSIIVGGAVPNQTVQADFGTNIQPIANDYTNHPGAQGLVADSGHQHQGVLDVQNSGTAPGGVTIAGILLAGSHAVPAIGLQPPVNSMLIEVQDTNVLGSTGLAADAGHSHSGVTLDTFQTINATKMFTNGLKVGTARQGIIQLVAGAATVANATITANTLIYVCVNTLGTVTTMQAVGVASINVAGGSFVIKSASAVDTSAIAYILIDNA